MVKLVGPVGAKRNGIKWDSGYEETVQSRFFPAWPPDGNENREKLPFFVNFFKKFLGKFFFVFFYSSSAERKLLI